MKYLPNILGVEAHRSEGFLESLVEPLKPSERFLGRSEWHSDLRRAADMPVYHGDSQSQVFLKSLAVESL